MRRQEWNRRLDRAARKVSWQYRQRNVPKFIQATTAPDLRVLYWGFSDRWENPAMAEAVEG